MSTSTSSRIEAIRKGDFADVFRNASPAVLYQHGVLYDGSTITSLGALATLSGEKTGRCPGDKRIVDQPTIHDDVWWGDVNIGLSELSFSSLREDAIHFLNSCERLYVVDGFAGWDPNYRLKIRIVCSRPYHALFMRNMLIRPSEEELQDFGTPDYVIYNAGQCEARPEIEGVDSTTSVALNFDLGEMVILGTEYAGEMKKGVFTIMNYLMPKHGVLSMHCSANEGEQGDCSLFFGLSGTGKTTLSADLRRKLIGDDEHCWTGEGIFNIEGGCYAKCINLSSEKEPEIYSAIRYESVLENTVQDERTLEVDFDDGSITPNTRCSYPIEFIPNAKIPCTGDHPSNIILLTCDAFGILPPVARLTSAQLMYHFISGYTAKVAGTEVGITKPEATFSACFGGAFIVWHPTKYAELLAEKMEQHQVDAWLVNTGWIGGEYGSGSRIKLNYTRAIIDAIHDGELSDGKVTTRQNKVFGFEVPESCPGVPSELLHPRAAWADKDRYDQLAKELAGKFLDNFKDYESEASQEILAAAPKI